MLLRALDKFFKHEASGGILLMLAAVGAMLVANSSLSEGYHGMLNTYFAVTYGGEGLQKPLILWINDGLMAVFFCLIGMELKRELLEGKLKNPSDVILPGMAAVGGMIVPALIYSSINWGNAETIRGWAIPAATDIAFALGVLALVGTRAPSSLKVFLLTLAILDDMGAIIIIALFYTADLKLDYLFLALVPMAGAQQMGGQAQFVAGEVRDRFMGRGTDLTLTLSQGVPWRAFTLTDPPRLVVDFREVDWTGADADAMDRSDAVTALRMGPFREGWSRLVAELDGPMVLDRAGMRVTESTGSAALEVALSPASLTDMAAGRGIDFGEVSTAIATAHCTGSPVCALAIATYTVAGWDAP